MATEAQIAALAKAREARAAKTEGGAVTAAPTLEEKVQILWAEHEANNAKLAARAKGRVIVYQCRECGETTTGLHPNDPNRGAEPILCPNFATKHFNNLTPMDYDPES